VGSIRQNRKDAYANALLKWILGFAPPAPKKATLQPNPTSKPKPQQLTLELKPVQIQLTAAKPIELRDYQKQALEEFLKRKRGTIQMATSTGKTFVALAAIKTLKLPTLIVVPTIAILKQVWLRRLKEAGISPGVFYGEKKQLTPVLVTTYHSASLHPEIIGNYKFVVFDEAHHTKADVWGKLLEYTKSTPYVLGLTATLGRRFDPKTLKVTRHLPVIFSYEIYEARKHGWVAPIQVFSVPVEMNLQERVKYEDYCEIIRRTAWQLGTTDPTVWAKLAASGNPTAKKGLWAMAKRRTLLSSIEAKFPAVLNIVRQNPNKKTLLFSEAIASIEKLKTYLRQNKIQCDVYHSKQPKNQRDIILKAWEQGQFPVLLSCTALEEGLDVKSAEVGIFLASGKSPRKIKQRIGRILRYMPGKIAQIYVIWCKGTIERDILTAVEQAIWKIK